MCIRDSDDTEELTQRTGSREETKEGRDRGPGARPGGCSSRFVFSDFSLSVGLAYPVFSVHSWITDIFELVNLLIPLDSLHVPDSAGAL